MKSFKYYFSAFSGGFAVMAVEMTTTKTIAPYYGTSAFIWAFIISIVMAYVFIGGLIGGRFADIGWTLNRLAMIHCVGAFLILTGALTVSLGLENFFYKLPFNAFILGFVAFVSVALISLPVLFFSMTSPWIIAIMVNTGQYKSGSISGRIYGASTLGGLAGTFIPILITIPMIGSRLSYVVFGSFALISAVMVLWRGGKQLTALVLITFFIIISVFYTRFSKVDYDVLYHTESLYNTIWVTENKNIRMLMVNERKAVQSLMYKNPNKFPYDVWSGYLAGAFMTKGMNTGRVLFVGLGGGSVVHYFNKYLPQYDLTGVEIDRTILETGRKYFGLDEKKVKIINSDARAFLNNTDELYDVIIMDAFQFPYLPPYLSTVEFMQLLQRHIALGGAVLFNVGQYENYKDLVKMVAQTGASVFPNCYEYEFPNKANSYVVCSDHKKEEMTDQEIVSKNYVKEFIYSIIDGLAPVEQGDLISTDDRPLSELLTNKVVLQVLGVLP